VWTREAIAVRVAALADEHHGPALIEAVSRFSEQLDDDERAVLGEVLLERARAEPPSLEGIQREGWLQRRLRRLERRRAE
jgi:hypothetical protein